MKQSKRILSVLLAVLMALSALSVFAAAAEPTIPTSGKVSRVLADGTEEKEAIEWSLSDDGTLTITGQGELHAEAAAAWEKLMPSIKKAVIGEGITNIPGGFLNACDTLESVSFPTSLQMISIYTFSGCSALKSITIPQNVKAILAGAFQNCTSLKSVVIPDSVTDLASGVFAGCTALETAAIGTGIKTIFDGTFSGCTALKSVTLGKNVVAINDKAFQNCTSLKDVNYAGSEADWAAITIGAENEALKTAAIHYDGGQTTPDKPAEPVTDPATEPTTPAEPVEIVPTWNWTDETLATATFVSADGKDTTNLTASKDAGTITEEKNANGETVYTASVTFGGKTYTDVYTVAAPVPEKTWNAPTWNWSNETLARATFVSTDGSDTQTVTATAKDGMITSKPGKDGATVYTATVTFEGKTYTNDFTVSVPNVSEPTWVWENESLARATFVSADGMKMSASASAEAGTITSEKKANGDVVYTATVTFSGKTYTNQHVVKAPTYDGPVWKWNGTDSATATFTAKNGKTKRVTATTANGGIVTKTKGTCGTNGKIVSVAKITFGGKTYTDKVTKEIAHKYKSALTPATTKAAGVKVFTCTVCGKKVSNVIPKIDKVSLSETKIVKDGKKHTPTVTVKDAKGKTLKKNKAYTVTYAKGRKNLGVYTVTVTFKGLYSGTKTLKFKILPKAPKQVTATPGSGNATITWKAVPGATRYYVYCMREGGKSFLQAANVRGTSAVIGSLKDGVTYLFKIRAVKENGTSNLVGPACKAVKVTPAAAPAAAPTAQPTAQAAH